MPPSPHLPSHRIGTLTVHIPHCPHARLQGLLRLPAQQSAQATLELETVPRASWKPELDRGGDIFRKRLASHQCQIDFPRRHVHLRFVEGLDETGWQFVFRDLFAALCGLSGDALLHASTVEHGGEATAFCAYSGGGKSTIAQLLGGAARTINDEINWAFRDAEGRFRLVDQRFYHQPPGTDRPDLPLARLLILVQAPACSLSPVDPQDAFPIVLAAPFGNDPYLPDRAACAADLFGRLPVHRLSFNLVPEDIRAVLGWCSHA